MKILAFDSTAKIASVAVSDGEKILAEYSIDNGLTQSELLLPMAEAVLGALKLSFSDVELFACSVGPGSFTGVRIGAALIKGLAFGKSIPCAEVSTLEALAHNMEGIDGIIVPCMDARRGQFYSAIFESSPSGIRRLCADEAISAEELAKKLDAYKGKSIYAVGDGYESAVKLLSPLGVSLSVTPPMARGQNAAQVARVAAKMAERAELTSDDAVSPTYLRVPQAERERLERLAAEKK